MWGDDPLPNWVLKLMAIRWRQSGELVCAATSKKQDGDTYIDDRLHYFLSVECGVLIADIDHEKNRLWHWAIGGRYFLRAVRETPVLKKKEESPGSSVE